MTASALPIAALLAASLALPAQARVPLPPEKPDIAEAAPPLPEPRPQSMPLPPEKPEVPETAALAVPPAPATPESCAALAGAAVEAAAAGPLTEPDKGCMVPRAYRLTRAGPGQGIQLGPAALLTCGMVGAVDSFFGEVLQPLARKHLGSEVTAVSVAASYVCRTRNNIAGARPSEHGRANALDISRFELADGRAVTVTGHWDEKGGEGKFLRAVHEAACGPFTTVIGPDGDSHHQDHFHFDLIARGKDGKSTWCR